MNKRADLICLSHLRWGFVFQRPNHLMSRCARERRVFFFEEPIYDADQPHLAVTRVARRLYVGGTAPARASSRRGRVEQQRALLERAVRDATASRPRSSGSTRRWRSSSRATLPRSRASTTAWTSSPHFRGAPPRAARARGASCSSAPTLVFTGGQSLYEAKRAQHPQRARLPEQRRRRALRAGARLPLDEPPIRRRFPTRASASSA